jgi:hypothetical protein
VSKLSPEVRLFFLQALTRLSNGKKVQFLQPYEGLMIRATMRLVPDSTTPDNSSAFIAEVEFEGHHYEARSRRGASCVLARKLKEAGVPDQPMSVLDEEGKELFRWKSFYVAAEKTFGESARMPLRMGQWVNMATRLGTDE